MAQADGLLLATKPNTLLVAQDAWRTTVASVAHSASLSGAPADGALTPTAMQVSFAAADTQRPRGAAAATAAVAVQGSLAVVQERVRRACDRLGQQIDTLHDAAGALADSVAQAAQGETNGQ